MVGGGEFATLARAAGVIMVVIYLLFFQQSTWKIGLALCFLDFSFLGLGFSIAGIEQSMLLAGILVLVTWWRKARLERPAILESTSFGLLNLFLVFWLIYSTGHLVFNHLDPFRPSDYSPKNFLKTAVQFSGPAGLLVYFIHRSGGMVVGPGAPRSIAVIGLFSLVFAIGIKLWEFSQGLGGAGEINPLSSGTPLGFTIPSLYLAAGYYTLRAIPIVLAPFATVFEGTKWLRAQSVGIRCCFFLIPPLSMVGALLSGGRATVAFVVFLMAAAHIFRGRLALTVRWGALLFVGVLGANLAAPMIRNSPAPVQRSLSWALVTKDPGRAEADISSSTSWRWELFTRSLEEWTSDRRIFWFGRGVYSFTMADEIAMRQDGWEGTMESSRRRGATHNLVTDLLVIYGLCGAILYLGMFAGLVCFMWSAFRSKMADEVGRGLALTSFLIAAFGLSYGILGGGNISPTLAWLVVATVAYFYRLQAVSKEPSELKKPKMIGGRTTAVPLNASRSLLDAPSQRRNSPRISPT